MKYDVFISHATEDKDSLVRPLAAALSKANVSVWYDEFSLAPGDHLRTSIEEGIRESKLGLVIFSPAFFGKRWPKQELSIIRDLEASRDDGTRLFPIWFNVGVKDVEGELPGLELRAAILADRGLDAIVEAVLRKLTGTPVPVINDRSDRAFPFTWISGRTGCRETLTHVAIGADHALLAVGDDGLLIRSHDSGLTWRRVALPTANALRHIAISADLDDGWIVGDSGTLLRTTNGGLTWVHQRFNNERDATCVSYCHGDRAACIAFADGTVIRHSGGEYETVHTGFDGYPWRVRFDVSGRVGCIVGGGGRILVTTDAGRTWVRRQSSGTPSVYGCAVRPDGSIWITGDEGLVCRSTDLGESWQKVALLPKSNPWDTWLNACEFSPSGRRAAIVGSQGAVAVSLDGGETWTSGRLQDRAELVDIVFVDDETLAGIGYSGVAMVSKLTRPKALT